MTYIKGANVRASTGTTVNLRCPICLKETHFSHPPVPSYQDIYASDSDVHLGVRICANPECKAVVFFFRHRAERPKIYPAEVMAFDSNNLPAGVQASLREAIQCHAHECHRAAAIMIRRTLEEVCENKEAGGANLHQRLEKLKSLVLLPPDLMEGLDHLKYLGNDAAHIESKHFDRVDYEEVSVGLELTIVILRAVYQMGELVNRIKLLQKPTS